MSLTSMSLSPYTRVASCSHSRTKSIGVFKHSGMEKRIPCVSMSMVMCTNTKVQDAFTRLTTCTYIRTTCMGHRHKPTLQKLQQTFDMAIAKAMASADTALSAAWHYSEGLSMGKSKVWVCLSDKCNSWDGSIPGRCLRGP